MSRGSRVGWAMFAWLLVVAGPAQAGTIRMGPWLQDARTDGMSVLWETSAEERVVRVEYGADASYGAVAQASHELVLGAYHVYTAVLTGLTPGTPYHYRVISGDSTTPDRTLRTAPPAGATGFRFYVTGDNRSAPETWRAVATRILTDIRTYPENNQTFVLNTGDIVADGPDYSEYWDMLFEPAEELLAHVPLYVGFGNHEDANTVSSDALLGAYFRFPYLASGSTEEKWFSFRWGEAHVAALALWDDAGFTSGPQRAWIEADLLAAEADPLVGWRFVVMHETPWSYGAHSEWSWPAPSLRDHLHPLFRDTGLDVAFGGHNHVYARYEPLGGVSYVTTGGSGAYLHTGSHSAWGGATLAVGEAVNHFVVVDIDETGMSLRAIDSLGGRFDYATFGDSDRDRPPLADAGRDREVSRVCPASLDGGASEDPEGGVLGYAWRQLRGPADATLADPTAARPAVHFPAAGDYVFELRVSDGRNLSTPDHVVVTAGDGPVTHAVPAIADTFVDDSDPDGNFGDRTGLEVDGSPVQKRILLAFDVGLADLCGTMTGARLRLYCYNDGDDPDIRTVNAWDEHSVTWTTQPIVGETSIARLPGGPVGGWVEVDLSAVVRGPGTYRFALLPSGSSGADFHSRESGTGRGPEILLDVAPPLAPTAKIVAQPGSGEAPLTVHFDGSGSGDPDGPIVSYQWRFGDGETATGEAVTHTYTAAGAYEVELTVTDEHGAFGRALTTIQALSPASPEPSADVPTPPVDVASPDTGGPAPELPASPDAPPPPELIWHDGPAPADLPTPRFEPSSAVPMTGQDCQAAGASDPRPAFPWALVAMWLGLAATVLPHAPRVACRRSRPPTARRRPRA